MGSEGDKHTCWICYEEDSDLYGISTLSSPCKCPRKVHPKCLARWQLQQAGQPEEKLCRFCNSTLADWRENMTPEELKPQLSRLKAIMNLTVEGKAHRIPVKPGSEGLREFTIRCRELLHLPHDAPFDLVQFVCRDPMSGEPFELEGMGAFDAAIHCALLGKAAERQCKDKKSSTSGSEASGPPALQAPPMPISP